MSVERSSMSTSGLFRFMAVTEVGLLIDLAMRRVGTTMSKRPMNGMHQSNGPQWDVEKYLESAPGCVTLLHFQIEG